MGIGGRTNLVEHEDELLATSVQTPQLPLDGPAPRSDGVSSIEHLDQDIARFQNLAQTLRMQLETRVRDEHLVVVLSILCHLVLETLRVGSERSGESSRRCESGIPERPSSLSLPPRDLLLLSLYTRPS